VVNGDLSFGFMHSGPPDLAQVRLDNALKLFDEFVRATARHADAATLRGLEGRFAERVEIQPSYWSQIKSRSRQIGERLARQFEQRCHKPPGWMDVPHAAGSDDSARAAGAAVLDEAAPRDDDERFIVGLVLTYYRRHPQRARTRLLDLLGEVLTPEPTPTAAGTARKAPAPSRAAVAAEEEQQLWRRARGGVAPLKPRR
jgi:hypothetical protein